MYCKNCGFENENNAVFCASCGASLDVEEGTSVLFEEAQSEQTESYDAQNDYIVPPYSEEQDYSSPVFEAEAYSPNGAVEKKKDDSKTAFILGLVGFVLGTTCCCFFWLYFVEWIFTLAGLVLGVLGLIKSLKALKQEKETGKNDVFTILGIVFSALAIVTGVIGTIFCIGYTVYAIIAFGLTGLTYGAGMLEYYM